VCNTTADETPIFPGHSTNFFTISSQFSGNLLTMVALPFSHKIRNASTWFVVNLAATECLFCITILPMVAAHLLRLRDEGEPLFSDDGCRAFVFLRYVNVQAELLSIAGVALNR
jgi:hypothetical protein